MAKHKSDIYKRGCCNLYSPSVLAGSPPYTPVHAPFPVRKADTLYTRLLLIPGKNIAGQDITFIREQPNGDGRRRSPGAPAVPPAVNVCPSFQGYLLQNFSYAAKRWMSCQASVFLYGKMDHNIYLIPFLSGKYLSSKLFLLMPIRSFPR